MLTWFLIGIGFWFYINIGFRWAKLGLRVEKTYTNYKRHRFSEFICFPGNSIISILLGEKDPIVALAANICNIKYYFLMSFFWPVKIVGMPLTFCFCFITIMIDGFDFVRVLSDVKVKNFLKVIYRIIFPFSDNKKENTKADKLKSESEQSFSHIEGKDTKVKELKKKKAELAKRKDEAELLERQVAELEADLELSSTAYRGKRQQAPSL